MAKHASRHSAHHTAPRRDISLESILESYRSMPEPGEEPSAEEPSMEESPAGPIPEIEEDGLPAELAEEEYTEELIPEDYDPAAALKDDLFFADEYAPEESAGEEAPAPEITEEGFEEDPGYYAGALPEDEEPEKEPAEDAEAPGREKKARQKKGRPAGELSLRSLQKKLLKLLDDGEGRRQQRKEQPEPEIEDKDREMEPRKAVRFYAAQMPSLRLRGLGAAAVCVLLVWITFSCCFGWSLPGHLEGDIRLSSFVVLCGELTVLLLGLDIITSGIMSLLRGRPGAESLLALASLASVLDAVFIIASKNGTRGLPFCAVPAVAVTCALMGSLHVCQGYRFSFLALHHARNAFAVTSGKLGQREGKYLIKSRHSAAGFIRRSEEPDAAETMCDRGFLPMAAGSLALALALSVGGGDMGGFFRLFALFTAVCASFTWLWSIPLFFEQTAAHLLQSGSAVAGWTGARDVGAGYRLIITDSDLFPEGTVEITGMRLLDKGQQDRIISAAGSLLFACGTGSAGVFSELMRRKNVTVCPLEGFEVGEGGASAQSEGQTIRIGTLGYMHLSGVKIPDKLKYDCALYTSIDEELMGLFLFRYRPTASVQQSLIALRAQRRRPLFATRDFNLDPLRIKKDFGVSTEGFDFPSVPERYLISGVPESAESPVSGVMARDGLDTLVDFAETSASFFRKGQICTLLTLISVIAGAIWAVIPGWQGDYAAISAAKVLIYNLFWLLPTVICAILFRK